jgi:Anticodon-binding domain
MSLYSIGTEIKVETTTNDTYVGRIYSYDEDSKLLVLFKGSEVVRDFVFINTNYIKSITVTDSNPRGIDFDIPDIDLEKYMKEVEKRIAREMDKTEVINTGVPPDVQTLFNELSKTNKCEWEGVNIYLPVLNVRILPLYNSGNSVIGPEPARNRIVHVLSQIRAKLNLD